MTRLRRSAGTITLLAMAVLTGACGADSGTLVQDARVVGPLSKAEVLTPDQYWNSATIYFLLTDRFHNGDPANDNAAGRTGEAAVLRGYEGGDLAGLTVKIEEGYFEDLGVDAIWLTPFVEQIRGSVDEGTGQSYGFHGYWARDWTKVEPNLGTEEDLRRMVETAHERGIRVIMDAVIQHTGPATELDPAWPADWVRTGPACRYQSYETTVECTLVENLPDILTGSDEEVDLPPTLVAKWEAEGRLEQEVAELDAWFAETGYPRAPRYYLMKWLSDWVREYGFDAWRVDTVKHFQKEVSAELAEVGARAFEEWRSANPEEVRDDLPFWVLGEVYNYSIENDRIFFMDGGEPQIDYYDFGYDALINFDFRNGGRSLDEVFTDYAAKLAGPLAGVGFVNYVSSHDDGTPWDRQREQPYFAGTRLLLAPGGAQIYYGDEIARPLDIDGTNGDADLRSTMEWDAIGPEAEAIREHWAKLGRFRQRHPAIGAGVHRVLQPGPYVFSRSLEVGGAVGSVVVALEQPAGPKWIPVRGVFDDGERLRDAYSGVESIVVDDQIEIDSPFRVVLLERIGS